MIFVIDSCDSERLELARTELQTFLRLEEVRDCVLLIFCNKQDLPGALSVSEILSALEFPRGDEEKLITNLAAELGTQLGLGNDVARLVLEYSRGRSFGAHKWAAVAGSTLTGEGLAELRATLMKLLDLDIPKPTIQSKIIRCCFWHGCCCCFCCGRFTPAIILRRMFG